MATAPSQAPDPSQDPSADPTAGADESAEPPEGTSSDFVIEIRVSGQSISESVESADEESSEESGSGEGGDDSEGAQTVSSIGAACALVKQIFAAGGQAQASGQGDADMAAGYK